LTHVGAGPGDVCPGEQTEFVGVDGGGVAPAPSGDGLTAIVYFVDALTLKLRAPPDHAVDNTPLRSTAG